MIRVMLLLLVLLVFGPAGAKDWKVESPPGERQTVPIEVQEGTWMSLDLSPDGRQLVFDMLGDLYLLPVGGGQAKNLTSGVAWDMQPRFSPDGRKVLFTSDRGGGDNLWIIELASGKTHQVTKESFRLVSSPVWEPGGAYVAGRKHFTSQRSLGSGEVWLYPAEGGGGLQMVKRDNDQKDLGEPAFSPDGRYLYYSQDVTPGESFEYNKDPHKQIYVIKRLDRQTGETTVVLSGPGGAIRPTPSPDGRTLAFIRRLEGRTTLLLHDLESGANRPLYHELERDMQETWAVHGVYPTMAWTADSKAIFFWAQGKIWRLEVSNGTVAQIPFQVKDRRTILPALRFPHRVAPDQFDVKAVRWAQLSPDGGTVLFQALGHIYTRKLPDGRPQRLTNNGDDVFEFYPRYSRNGRAVVYVAWSDKNLGSVAVWEGGRQRTLAGPGHFLEPEFSPSGAQVVYRKLGGSNLLSPLWGKEPGLYRVSSSGGEPEKLRGGGSRPHFGPREDHLYFVEGSELKRLDLTNREVRSLYKGEEVSEFLLAPDGSHLAFLQGFKAFMTPFVETGQAIDLSRDTKAYSVRKVSDKAGYFISWSGSRLTWSVGPEFSIDGGGTHDLSFKVPYARPQSSIALVGARVITMEGDQVLADGTVVVQGNRITQVGPSSSVSVPAGAERVDCRGKVIMPGLVDVHWHGSQGWNQIIPQQNWTNLASLAFGITTLHDPSNDTAEIFSAAELARAGKILAPRIYSTGTILYGAKAYDYYADVNSLEDALSHVARLQKWGATTVKSYNQPRREQRQQLLEAARQLKMMVVPEGGSTFQHNMSMVVDGHTGVEHSLPVVKVYKDVLDLWGASKTGYTPTLGVAYGGIMGENYWYDVTDVWKNQRLRGLVPPRTLDARARRRTRAPLEDYNHIQAAANAKRLLDRGILVNLGAHGQREGLAAHWEIWMFAQGGMSAHEALRSATLNGARYVGLDQDIGSLKAGKLADLLILDRDPLQDIRNSDSISRVMLNGRLYDAESMNQLYPERKARPPLWWE